jgi:hypothetical protein
MIGDGWISQAAFGCSGGNPTMKGLAATATNPASMTINIAPGAIFSPAVVDLNQYSTLGSDTTHSVTKIGINQNVTPIVFTAPLTSGNSQIFLIQVQLQEVDTGNTTLNYFDSANPGQVYSGPNNTGISQPTQRQDICAITVVAGVPAGSPVAPTVTLGWVGAYLVTIPFGTVAITQGMITVFPGAKFLNLSLCDLQSGGGGGGGSGTVTQVNTGTGLVGGPITTTGTISLANTSVAAGSYTNANLTVNAQGQITSVANGSSGSGGGSGTVFSVTAGGGLTGGTITTSGTIAIQGSSAAGVWTNANITVDAFGRVTVAANGTGGAGTNYQPQIDVINGTLTVIEGEIATIQGEITTINGQITTLQNNQTTTNTAISVIQGNIATLNSTTSGNSTSITTINNTLNGPLIRYRLQATLNINIATTGNDVTAAAAIHGPTPTPSSTPFLTLQKAWDTIINAYDVSGQTINFFMANGTYSQGIVRAQGITGLTDTGTVNIIGNPGSPSSVLINVSQGNCFDFADFITVGLNGIKMQATVDLNKEAVGVVTGNAIVTDKCVIEMQNLDFGNCDRWHIIAFGGSDVHSVHSTVVGTTITNRITNTISGSAVGHVLVQNAGFYSTTQSQMLIAGSPVFSGAIYTCVGGLMNLYQTEFSGTQGNATGQRYSVVNYGTLDNGGVDPDNGPTSPSGQQLPGSVTGTTARGGLVI